MTTFKCEHCGGSFPDDDDNDHTAALEMDALYSPRENMMPQAQICDECFARFDKWRRGVGLGDKLQHEN